LGKTSIRDVEVYSTCLAVENLWLAARAEGLGVGWVSILRNDALHRIFSIPDQQIPVAYLCIGYVASFPDRPALETAGWGERLSPRKLIHFDSWDSPPQPDEELARLVESPEIWQEIFPADTDSGQKNS
jgi:5,6-dimethylbenzimidazole synthase